MGHSRCCGTEAKVQDLPCIYICISLYTNTLSLHSHTMSCFDRQRLSLNVSGVAGAGAGDVAQFLGGTQGPCHSLLAQSLGPWDPGAVGWISWGPWGLEGLEYTGNTMGSHWLEEFPVVDFYGGIWGNRFEAGNLVRTWHGVFVLIRTDDFFLFSRWEEIHDDIVISMIIPLFVGFPIIYRWFIPLFTGFQPSTVWLDFCPWGWWPQLCGIPSCKRLILMVWLTVCDIENGPVEIQWIVPLNMVDLSKSVSFSLIFACVVPNSRCYHLKTTFHRVILTCWIYLKP